MMWKKKGHEKMPRLMKERRFVLFSEEIHKLKKVQRKEIHKFFIFVRIWVPTVLRTVVGRRC
jgi:hypothetical protein